MNRTMLACGVVMAVLPLSAADFRYQVRRDKLWGGEAGILTISESGVAYESGNGKTAIELPYQEIRKLDVSDPQKVRVWTYERVAKRLTQRRKIEFDLVDGIISNRLSNFLADHLERPVLGTTGAEPTGVEIAAYHRHMFGGCNGALVLGETTVQFVSKDPQHSRTWFFEDIETIGSMNPFHFRMSSYAETYNFDLKKRLPEESYRGLWLRVYGTAATQESQPMNKEIDRL